MKKINKKYYPPFLIHTDFGLNIDDFKNLLNETGWVDSNILYKDYLDKATGTAKPWKYFFIKPINTFNMQMLRIINIIFKNFNISPKEFRCDFFKILPGGSLPFHIDQTSKISFCVPLTKNTCETFFEDGEVKCHVRYKKMVVLNNLIKHAVGSPTKKRILFRIGVHDISFEELYESQRV